MPYEPALTVAPLVEHPRTSVAGADATTAHDAPVAALPASTATVRYVLGAEIARGGMGAVYRATDAVFGREVAIKVLLETYAPESGIARRFQDEARITGQLQHPGIPPAHDLGTLPDGRPFLAMKLIKGDTLHDLLKQRSDLAADRGRLVAVFEGVCQAMAYAHAHGVVHRDLKPSNIMVGAFGEVQVMDWGLAKVLGDGRPSPSDDPDVTAAGSTAMTSTRDIEELLTKAGSVLGTPAYMPPEQATGAIHEVDRRSDVFGLGGILASVLTGQPPFVGDTARTTWGLSARGEVQECVERLERCEADPGLVALAKRCLAPKREDRPADAEAVANEVAALRAAADDRARRAEVELATTATATAERRKRRRVWLGAVAALAVALFGGLGAVLAVQRRANADMAAANGKLAAKNDALEAERVKVEQRFDMARKAIAAFHTTIDEQPELGNEAFRPLRRTLLTAAAGFYRELEELLADDPDPKSRAALADGYFQLAELAVKIGDQTEALAVYRKALALRRELAARGADADTQLSVSVAVRQVGKSLAATGDTAGALRAYEEARDVAAALETAAPTDAVRQALADSHYGIGAVLSRTGQPAEAMAAYQRARDLRQKLADAHPAVTAFQSDVAESHISIGIELQNRMGKPAEALVAFREALAIRQKLADANPTVIALKSELARSYFNIGVMLRYADQPEESLAASENARDIYQKLADANPAVTKFQDFLASSHQCIAWLLGRSGKRKEALAADQKALDILEKLADAHPAVTQIQSDLAQSHYNIGKWLEEGGQLPDALAAKERALEIYQKLADANPAETEFQLALAQSHHYIGKLLGEMGQPREALAAYQKARDNYHKLADANPTVSSYRAGLASAENGLGRLLAKEERFAEAFAALDAGLAIREKLVAADTKTTNDTNHLGYSHAYRGWARVRAGQPKEAAADLLKAVELWGETTDPDAEDFFEQARALALLAVLVHDPNAGVTSDEAKGFADRSAAALANAVKAGWVQPAELREPDFDAVRDRTDFRKLQAELEVGAP